MTISVEEFKMKKAFSKLFSISTCFLEPHQALLLLHALWNFDLKKHLAEPCNLTEEDLAERQELHDLIYRENWPGPVKDAIAQLLWFTVADLGEWYRLGGQILLKHQGVFESELWKKVTRTIEAQNTRASK